MLMREMSCFYSSFTGLLIEPSSDYETLLKKNRKAKSLNVCLAIKNFPHEVEFLDCDVVGGIKGIIQKNTATIFTVLSNCITVPLRIVVTINTGLIVHLKSPVTKIFTLFYPYIRICCMFVLIRQSNRMGKG